MYLNSQDLKQKLHDTLSSLPSYDRCSLLDYPAYPNLGDHLIWIGSFLWLTRVYNTQIEYAASITSFSKAALEKQSKSNDPIFLNGGGNLGDLWPDCQKFREYIITTYQQRPIIILPQTIYFKDIENLKKTAHIFNSHPDLTIILRDRISYEIAQEHFTSCKLLQAPDMALELVDLPEFEQVKTPGSRSILYLCRKDRENKQDFSLFQVSGTKVKENDWVSFKWKLGINQHSINGRLATLFREGWQRGLHTPREWMSRQTWNTQSANYLGFRDGSRHHLTRQSWDFIHSGVYQFKQYDFVITDRLHGHILCLLLEIPHLFLPNAYHKNSAFYQAWTAQIPFCRFAEDLEKVDLEFSKLMER